MEKKGKHKHNTGSTVWHHYDGDGNIIRHRLQQGQNPPEGQNWQRGFGPHSAEVREKIAEKNRQVHCGKFVSPITRERMRQAKLGVPKTLEHRINMSLAQTRRHLREQSEK